VRILVVSNLYPPHVIGGYEALCCEVADGLQQRGHDVQVLTSTCGVDREITEGHVHRVLALESDLQFYKVADAWSYPRRKRRNLEHLRRLVTLERPDIVFVWGMWNLTKSLAQEAEALVGSGVVYYLANPWPIEPNLHQAFWDMPARSFARNIAKQVCRVPARLVLGAEWTREALRFEHAPCCSQAQRDQLMAAGVPLRDAPVISEGIDLAPYLAHAERRTHERRTAPLSLLYVGILAEHKGVHTAIEALGALPPQDLQRVHLTILGQGHEQYERRLRDLVAARGLASHVSFQAPIPRAQLPDYLGSFDVLVLPSIWSEPLSRVMQEGLASGMVVIGSATGGTAETIVHGRNGLLFPAGDAAALAAQVQHVLEHGAACRDLSAAGVQTARERFDIVTMVSRIEAYLEQVDATILPR
jgi:glycosyltransferase involved in cell wall biosynthesis